MDKKIKQKWLKALRSGKYRQTKNELISIFNNKRSFCCLGVLGKVNGFSNNELLKLNPLGTVKSCAGLRLSQREKLADLNDRGKSFKQIANYIEKYYK